jgi:heme/copper-type cytochrome/quinol oxidase subunit 2
MVAAMEPLPEWLNFLIMTLAIVLVAIGCLIWFLVFRKKRKRKHRPHSHEKRQLNPTLAECGGLPPKRDPEPPANP